MFDESRTAIYDYLYGLVYDVVTKNVYRMSEPTDTTESDANDGFVVIRVGNINDDSEFTCNAYGWVRCTITAYVPKKTRGRLDNALYRQFESSINSVINNATESNDSTYYISGDSVLSADVNEASQKGNQYHVYVKSFVVMIDGANDDDNEE